MVPPNVENWDGVFGANPFPLYSLFMIHLLFPEFVPNTVSFSVQFKEGWLKSSVNNLN